MRTIAALLLLSFVPAIADPPPITDKTVESAILRGVDWLKTQRNPSGHWESSPAANGDHLWGGNSGLALLALLYSGQDPRSDDMAKTLDWLAGASLNGTYVYGVRAHVLSLVSGTKFRKRLDGDLTWLTTAMYSAGSKDRGAYDYKSVIGQNTGRYDNSNSQFGVLGVWMATEAGERADALDSYWRLVEEHWLRDQNADGGWGYIKGTDQYSISTGSMTAAGLATLYVILDRVHARTGHKSAKSVIAAIDGGLDWLGREFTPNNPHGESRWKYYYLYGVERAGRASGRKYFRDLDWFREGGSEILKEQQPDGSWPGGMHPTCFALMFLCHGRAPLLFNKLEKGDDWDNHLRDVASLTRYANHTFEKLLNWQIVSLDGTIEDLLEAPVLYLHGTKAWEFSETEIARLREYSERGGLLLAVCPKEAGEFRKSIEALAAELFPNRKLRRLPARDPLFSGQLQFPIESPPEVLEIHSGVRPLMLLVGDDIAAPWNRYDVKKGQSAFQLGCNLYLYATDKTSIPSRLVTNTIPIEPTSTTRTIRVARIEYKGTWNIEPYGWQRLRTYINNATKTQLDVRFGVRLDSRELDGFKIAHITGSTAFTLSVEELAGLRRFLTDGGTLLADAALGSRDFLASLERNVQEALKVDPVRLPNDSPIFTAAGLTDALKLDKIEYRRASRSEGRGSDFPPLKCFLLGNRPAVIYSPLDISVGLLGTRVYECRGYDRESCLVVMRNLLLYSALPAADKLKLATEAR